MTEENEIAEENEVFEIYDTQSAAVAWQLINASSEIVDGIEDGAGIPNMPFFMGIMCGLHQPEWAATWLKFLVSPESWQKTERLVLEMASVLPIRKTPSEGTEILAE